MRGSLKAGLLISVFILFAFAFTGCGVGRNDGPGDFFQFAGVDEDVLPTLEVGWTGLDLNFEGQLNVVMFSSANQTAFLRDVGRTAFVYEDITELRAASTIAVARIFNTYFPNVEINFYCPSNRVHDFHNRRLGLYQAHGLRPHVFMSADIAGEIILGNLADLTIFADDPVFDLINPTMKRHSMHLDRIWAIPFLASPYGMFVNRGLAENQNLDVPPVNWNLNEFYSFTRNSRPNEFNGLAEAPFSMFETMTDGFHYQLLHRGVDDIFVHLNTHEMREMHRIVPGVNSHALRPQLAAGVVNSVWVAGRANFNLFAEGVLLVHHTNPYRIAFAGSPTHPNRIQVADWDYFPRPSTYWMPNHVSTNLIPLAIHNFAMDDGDPTLNQEEYDMLRLAWEFARFFTTDIRAWRAKSAFTWGPDGHSALDYSFPFVVGQLYWDMLDLHFEAEQRRIFASPTRFPGYHYIMQLWEQGANWGIWYNSFPFQVTAPGGGAMQRIDREWRGRGTAANVGAAVTAANWLDQLFVHLPVWDVTFNERWTERFAQMDEGFQRFYSGDQERLSR